MTRIRRTKKRRSLKSIAAVVLLVLIAAACSSSGHPLSYDDQIDEDTGLSNVEANWLNGCGVSLAEDLAAEANDVCACSYSRIKTQVPFEAFVEFDDQMRDDPTSITDRYNEGGTARTISDIVRDCIAEA